MSYISINKLFDNLEKAENIKTLSIYFDKSYVDKYNERQVDIPIILLGISYKDGTRKSLSFKDLIELFPNLRYIRVPSHIFPKIYVHESQEKTTGLCANPQELRKIIVAGEKKPFRDNYYHECKLYPALTTFNSDILKELKEERKMILSSRVKYTPVNIENPEDFI